MIELTINNILPVSALILSVINGLILTYSYLRDKPKLVVSPVHPEIYQYWSQLENANVDDKQVRLKT